MQLSIIPQIVDHLLLEAPKFLVENGENKKASEVFLTTLLQNPDLNKRFNLSPRVIGKITQDIRHTKEFVSFVQKSLSIAATHQLISIEDGLQSLSILKQIIKESVPLNFFEVLLKLSLSSVDLYEVLEVWNDAHPHQFFELLGNYQNQIIGLPIGSDQKIALLKTNNQIHPEILLETLENFGIYDSQSQIEMIIYLLTIYPEEMLYKIESVKSISPFQKLQCYLKAVALYPRLISNWRAAFFVKTRDELAKQSVFIRILMTYDRIKIESEAEKLVISSLENQWEECFGDKESFELLLKHCNFKNSFFSSRKELCIWLGFLLEYLSMNAFSQEELSDIVWIIPHIASCDHSLKYPLVAYLMIPEMVQHHLKKQSLNLSFSILQVINELFKIPIDLVVSLEEQNQKVILSTLLSLHLSSCYNPEIKKQLFIALQATTSPQLFLYNAYALRDLLSLQEPKLFENTVLSSLNLREVFFSIFTKYLSTDKLDLQDFFDHYVHTFGSFRIPEALFVYAKCLQKLPNATEKKIVLNALTELVLDVFSEEYTKKRYRETLSSHLQALSTIDSNLMTLWQKNEIKGPIAEFLDAAPRLTLEGCIVEETDQIEEVFICTTEVSGSCLSVRGNPEDNKSFLAIPLDGKNKILCVKEKNGIGGKMLGRAKLSLLVDDQDNGVLLLDTLFSSLPYEESQTASTPYEQMEKAIIIAAIRKAKMVNRPLLKTYSSSDQSHPIYPRPIFSLGGRAPIECCNAVGALGRDELCQRSKFEISKTQILWQPN